MVHHAQFITLFKSVARSRAPRTASHLRRVHRPCGRAPNWGERLPSPLRELAHGARGESPSSAVERRLCGFEAEVVGTPGAEPCGEPFVVIPRVFTRLYELHQTVISRRPPAVFRWTGTLALE